MHDALSLILGWRLLGGRIPKAQQVSELKLPRQGLLFFTLLPFSPCKDMSACCVCVVGGVSTPTSKYLQ